MFDVKETKSNVTPAKKNIILKNIAVEYLKFIDIDTGEDHTEAVLAAIPENTKSVNFKLTFEIPDDEE